MIFKLFAKQSGAIRRFPNRTRRQAVVQMDKLSRLFHASLMPTKDLKPTPVKIKQRVFDPFVPELPTREPDAQTNDSQPASSTLLSPQPPLPQLPEDNGFIGLDGDFHGDEFPAIKTNKTRGKITKEDLMLSMAGSKAMTIRGVSFDTMGRVSDFDREFQRAHICIQNTLQPRDLRKIDTSLSDQSQVILVREKAILVNLAHVRALVRADAVLVIASPTDSKETAQFHSSFIYELQGALGNPNDKTLFEIKVMEAIMNSASSSLVYELDQLEKESEFLLQSIDVGVSSTQLNKLLLLRRAYNKFLQRVEGFRSAINMVLTNDEDLAGMYVTDKALGKPHVVSDHIDMELMLEHYVKIGDDLVSKVLETSSNLQTTQNMIGIILDNTRNKLIVFDLKANLATAAISSAALMAGLLGMNLPNHIENYPHIFEGVALASLGIVFGIYFGAVQRMGKITKWKGLIWRRYEK
ncbi:magnesium ion transporter [Physocladia obscura]|uniref:Magnesium transporter n=1 Tax=Physocladia obscura TaxID=109957 RepID=A0AAD5SVM0_9FUNG|nr:magnesium ion transporter [Physocladia obscura]